MSDNLLEEFIWDSNFYTTDTNTFSPYVLGLLLDVISNYSTISDIENILKYINNIDPEYLKFFDDEDVGIFIYISKDGLVLNSNNTGLNISDRMELVFYTQDNNKEILSNIKIKINDVSYNKYVCYFNFPVKYNDGRFVINGRAFASFKGKDGVQKFYTSYYFHNKLKDNQESVIKYGIEYIFNSHVFYDIPLTFEN